ncbi:centriolar and ciliogenesis-associated protein HYLS1 [Patella vulgata]|uniref:centriolar and ciliogenesis-associated protein HYLS1 n=1 Tax=Patella vulgata TaxID=6465 RepID=UPI00218026B8|nr:centriolar and ciliogenesis-associated protein HYLS1 [Patella vulgata]XP_050405146.1 centriolar and ciliogenesis-associated protein HYLS1 [Patella vulgata]XP_050405147.1 centriolar and ciliogenesis-associated protein HYLS1 [Patella vulgata]
MEELSITDFDFSEDEILGELNRLGYHNVPKAKLKEFQRDLKLLIHNDKSNSINTSLSSDYHDKTTDDEFSPPLKIDISNTNANAGSRDKTVKISRDLEKEHNSGYERPAFVTGQPSRGHSLYSKPHIRDDVSETDSECRRMVKRKTVRKNEKGTRYIDESMTESDAGSVIDAHERLERMRLRDFDRASTGRRSRLSHSDDEEPPYRLADDDPRPASVILRRSEHPHTKNLRKSDPVAKYQQFKQVWQSFRAPGERDHKNLRWNIRERMLAQEVPDKKSHRVFVQNKYVVPTEKQRKTLRWQVRMDMAQGVKPTSGFFHEY